MIMREFSWFHTKTESKQEAKKWYGGFAHFASLRETFRLGLKIIPGFFENRFLLIVRLPIFA